jgi:hypothetical protein
VLMVIVSASGTVGDVFGQRAHRTVELTGDGCPMKALIDGLTRISAANPSTQLSIVDQLGIQVGGIAFLGF